MCDDATQYRRYWASATGKPESEIYVPLALRESAAEDEGDQPPAPTATVRTRHGGRTYDVELDVDSQSPGRVSGTVRKIEDVTGS